MNDDTCLFPGYLFSSLCYDKWVSVARQAAMKMLRENSLRLTGDLELLLRQEPSDHVEIFPPAKPSRRGYQLSLSSCPVGSASSGRKGDDLVATTAATNDSAGARDGDGEWDEKNRIRKKSENGDPNSATGAFNIDRLLADLEKENVISYALKPKVMRVAPIALCNSYSHQYSFEHELEEIFGVARSGLLKLFKAPKRKFQLQAEYRHAFQKSRRQNVFVRHSTQRNSHSTILLFIVVIVSCAFSSANVHLRQCGLYEDTRGEWKPTKEVMEREEESVDFEHHFIGLGGPGEALQFSFLWVPRDCAYHRFTAKTIESAVRHMAHSRPDDEKIKVFFLGDGALRGIFCGITRILSGSEIYGPCENVVCGGEEFGAPVSFKDDKQIHTVEFGRLSLSFAYVNTLREDVVWFMESIIKNHRPYALIFNSGAWDFEKIAHNNSDSTATPECDSDEARQIAASRASGEKNESMWELSALARKTGVRLIYRGNHFNQRFGAKCADELVEAMLQGSEWEIWDNMRISDGVWVEQCWDGFHFDRQRVNSRQHHIRQMDYFKEHEWELPGMMEMQLAQSILQALFYPAIKSIHKRISITAADSSRSSGEWHPAAKVVKLFDDK